MWLCSKEELSTLTRPSKALWSMASPQEKLEWFPLKHPQTMRLEQQLSGGFRLYHTFEDHTVPHTHLWAAEYIGRLTDAKMLTRCLTWDASCKLKILLWVKKDPNVLSVTLTRWLYQPAQNPQIQYWSIPGNPKTNPALIGCILVGETYKGPQIARWIRF